MVKISGKIVFAIIFCIIWLVALGMAFVQDINTNIDTTEWLDRAQVSSNPTDMKEYLMNCRDGMERYGITSGNCDLIFKNKPETDMSLIYKSLNNCISRCELIETMNSNTTEYNVALDDLRGTIRELDLHSTQAYWVLTNFWGMLYLYLGWIPVALLVILKIFE